jgi:ParB family chromosome partitioning protein
MSMESSSELIGAIEEIGMREIILSSNNPRNEVADINELIISISKIGLLQPIVVRTVDNHFEVVAGVRRYSACRKLGWRKISCHVVELDDKSAFEVALIENLHRCSLSILEESLSFKKYVSDFGWGSVSELAKKISKSPSYVSKRISLLELPSEVVNLISQSEIVVSAAEELHALKDKQKQHELAVKISTNHLSSKKVRQLVSDISNHYNMFDEIIESEGYLRSNSSNEQQHNLYKSIDKAIITLKIAVKKLVSLIENIDNWILYEILMQHKNSLVVQIDILIKERKKLKGIFPRGIYRDTLP